MLVQNWQSDITVRANVQILKFEIRVCCCMFHVITKVMISCYLVRNIYEFWIEFELIINSVTILSVIQINFMKLLYNFILSLCIS
jgi:hypothetical protein